MNVLLLVNRVKTLIERLVIRFAWGQAFRCWAIVLVMIDFSPVQSYIKNPNTNVSGFDSMYTRRDSNPHRWYRKPIFYPLNYGCILFNFLL